MSNTGNALCYLKPLSCELSEKWHFSSQYFAVVKGQLPKGCPAKPRPMLLGPAAPAASTSTSTPQGTLNPEDGKLYVIHTPAPGALPIAEEGPSWSITMTLHTPAPLTLAEKVFQSEPAVIPPAGTQGAWSEATASEGRWPEDVAPASQLTSPGDRWFAHLGKRCAAEGISQSEDLCLDHSDRKGFKGALSKGFKAVCLDVNQCMALCDATPGCFAVEMSQVVNRCELKGSHCLLHENWRQSDDSNLLVVGRLREGPGAIETSEHSANVPSCEASMVHRCPIEWEYDGNVGGFHCNHKLHYQTSEEAYLSSAGACRPASAGPFPYDDCSDQCRIQGKTGAEGRVPSCPPSTVSQCPAEWNWKGPGGFHCLRQLHYQYNTKAFLSSDGACRPASAGPFPYDDCSDQCRIGGASDERDHPEGRRDHSDYSGLEVLLDASTVVSKAATASAKAHLEQLTSAMHFGMMDIPGDEADLSYKYSSILHGPTAYCTLYFVPFNADNVGIFETASWTFRTVDISSFARGEFKYSSGVLYNEVAYFTPYGADHVGVFDLKTERFGRLGISAGSEECKYSAAIQRGSMAYFVPSSAENIGVLDMESRSFRTIPIPGAGAAGKWKYCGGVLHDGKCYFAPYNADNIGVLDVQSEHFQTIDISRSTVGDMKFTDAFVQNGVIYFVPFNANAVGALYLENHHFELVKIPNLAAENYQFWGAIQVGSLTYFVPDMADAVGVFEAATREYAQVDIRSKISMDFKFATGIYFNGVLYFSPRNARGIGMLQVGRMDADLCQGLEPVNSQAALPMDVIWEDRKVTSSHHQDRHQEHHHGHHGHHDGHHDGHHHGPHHGPHHGHHNHHHHGDDEALSATSAEIYAEPRPSWAMAEEQRAGKTHGVRDVFIALASIGLVLLPAELSREKWDGKINDGSLSFLRSLVVSTICAVCFFVLRSLFAGGAVPFWVQVAPAIFFFLVLWLLFQASLFLKPYDRRTARLDIVEILGFSTGLAGVDAGGAYLRCFDNSCMEAAAALMFYQMLLLALDGLVGWWAKMNRVPRADHRSTLLAPPALLSVEVLTFGLLGEFGPEILLNRLGVVQDGLAPGETAPFRLVLVLYALSCIVFAASQWLEHRKAHETHQVASLSACWAAIRASQWLGKLLLFPNQGAQLLLCVSLTALMAQLLSVELPDRTDSRSATVLVTTSSLPKPLGIAVGLLWASSIVRSSWLLVIVTVPQRVVYAQVHFMAVWLVLSLLVAAAMFYIKAVASSRLCLGVPSVAAAAAGRHGFAQLRTPGSSGSAAHVHAPGGSRS